MKSAKECLELLDAEASSKVSEEVRVFDLVSVNGVPHLKNRKDGKVALVVRQGDIYIHAVKSGWQFGPELKSNQLALGNTQGSRHIAEAPAKCYTGQAAPNYMSGTMFLGPVIKSEKEFTVSHPEHAHCKLPAGTYQVTHQMDAETQSRVQD